ncbi:uncharacterized protein [Linepithema humile]|uniref:uncharacterized protein n=1 Tax=Linepithema humile TaxID=83485 RepID=UPI0006230945|nr:PREDICTED: heterogeneous nuclear ribonucleoprotein A3-like [Linepithema humile]XP_012219770.1 PREDICTED: heterogeneous nuclear ribonucleoprotein A3-like [Linepithema humile]
MRRYLFLITILGVIFLKESLSKSAEIAANSDVLDPVVLTVNNSSETDAKREQRSPQFGLLGGDISDYSDYDYGARFFGSKRKFHRKPHYQHRPHGCRGYGGCGGWQPNYGGHYGGQGASFASASAGSVGSGPYGGGQSQANAQSASFNIGPFSASFSAAQSAAGHGF